MANIELIIEKIESLGFIEVVLSTTESFWQKKDTKIYLSVNRLTASIYYPEKDESFQQLFMYDDDIFLNLERVAQW